MKISGDTFNMVFYVLFQTMAGRDDSIPYLVTADSVFSKDIFRVLKSHLDTSLSLSFIYLENRIVKQSIPEIIVHSHKRVYCYCQITRFQVRFKHYH